MDKIDFVLPWVDGSDANWLAEKRKYENGAKDLARGDADANADCRYRDYGLLRYWFRAVEKFAPWVDRVFFVTCGQKPDWLDEACPKLRLVDHRDYIPPEYLPTFQSNTIELNLHRVSDLSEKFVLFNDDVFLLRPVAPEHFFKNGLPVLPCDIGIPRWIGNTNISRVVLNNAGVLKHGLDVNKLVWKNIWKFADFRALGFARAVKNVLSFAVNRIYIPGTFGHIALPHLKSTFEEIWRKQPRAMERTSQYRFRTDDNVNQWLVCAWNMVSGRFHPATAAHLGEMVPLTEKTLDPALKAIRRGAYPEICLNDKSGNADPDRCFAEIAKAFDSILPEKSAFEK